MCCCLLSVVKAEVEEKNNVIARLKAKLKAKEEELCNGYKRINEAHAQFGTDYKCLKTELTDTKSQTKLVVKKLKLERDVLSNQLAAVCDQLHQTELAFDEAKAVIDNDLVGIKNTVTELSSLGKGDESRHGRMAAQVQKLIEDNSVKNVHLGRINKKIKELQRDSERKVSKINKQLKQLQEWKWKMENP